MTHGHPDYGAAAPASTIYGVLDIGELAARLGSPVTFDRRGNVIWFDSFEHSFNKWDTSLAGSGASAAISNERARTGALSCKVVTGDKTDDLAMLYHYEPYPVLSKIGMELSLSPTAQNACFDVGIRIFSGTESIEAAIKYDFSADAWYYIDSSNNWAALTLAATMDFSVIIFHTIKLVVDPTTYKYVRLIVNNTSLDMSALDLYHPASSVGPFIEIGLEFWPTEDASKTIYYDDAILTQNEP